MLSEHINSFICQFNVLLRTVASQNHLSVSQYLTLYSISPNGITMSELSKAVGVDNSTLTRNIHILVRKLLVSKERSHEDRREFKVMLTEQGEKIIYSMEKQMDQRIESISSDLDSQQREQLIEIISKLNWKLSCHINEL